MTRAWLSDALGALCLVGFIWSLIELAAVLQVVMGA